MFISRQVPKLILWLFLCSLYFLLLYFAHIPLLAENVGAAPIAPPKFDVSQVDLTIDGQLAEPIWSRVPGFDRMLVIDPDTLASPASTTDTRIFYTDQGLYLGMHSIQDPSTLIERLSSRDSFINRDGMALTLDTSGAGLYGYFFGINLGGSLRDGTVLPERLFKSQWDGPWRGAAARTEDGWSAEMFLPWSMMTMPESGDLRRMGLYISRKVAHLDERWSWPALPQTGAAFFSALQPLELSGIQPRQELAFLPICRCRL